MKNWVLRLVRAVGRPLTLSQIMSSAAGAGVMVIAAASMRPADFTLFALLVLASNTLIGLFRSALFQPALITQRTKPGALVPFRYALVAGAAAAVLMLVTAYAFRVTDWRSLVALSSSMALPVLYDWLRFRAMGHDRRWAAAHSDLIRLLTLVPLVSPLLRSDPVLLQFYVSASTGIPLLFMVFRLPRLRTWEPYGSYRRTGWLQTVDYAFGATLVAAPLLVLGGISNSASIAGVRLAQSLLGPLNLAFAAATSNMVADGATRAEMAADEAVIRHGTRLGRRLAALSLTLVAGMVIFFWASGFAFRGVSNTSLLLGLALIGASSTTTGWTAAHGIVLRILGRQSRVTLARAIISVVTVAGFAIGFVLNGVTGSLVGGFLTLALAAPPAFLSIAAQVYRTVDAPLPRRALPVGQRRNEALPAGRLRRRRTPPRRSLPRRALTEP